MRTEWIKFGGVHMAVAYDGMVFEIHRDGWTSKQTWVCDVTRADGKHLKAHFSSRTLKGLKALVEQIAAVCEEPSPAEMERRRVMVQDAVAQWHAQQQANARICVWPVSKDPNHA